jgi:hypothetical protein
VTEIPTITLEEAEAETEGSGEVANLLNASRDVYQQVSGFGWSNFRFRERGYDSEHFPLFLNGVSINDPETGFAFYGEIGGSERCAAQPRKQHRTCTFRIHLR